MNCAIINIGTLEKCIPVKVSVRLLAIETAGFAKEVEEVNQIADVIYEPIIEPMAKSLFLPFKSIRNNKPNVAKISDTNMFSPLRTLVAC